MKIKATTQERLAIQPLDYIARVNAYVKTIPMRKIIQHTHELEIKEFQCPVYPPKKGIKGQGGEDSLRTSLARTKRVLHEYARNNDFSWFCTLTVDPKRFDSFDIERIYAITRIFTRQLREKGIKYIIVPEYHADKKKIHLHALIMGGLDVIDSGHTIKGKKTYNCPSWLWGFSTCVPIGNSEYDTLKVASYIAKYVTKDLLTHFHKKRYWASKGLKKGIVIFYGRPSNEIIGWDYQNNEVGYRVKTIRNSTFKVKS
jgi:hypothetical protein